MLINLEFCIIDRLFFKIYSGNEDKSNNVNYLVFVILLIEKNVIRIWKFAEKKDMDL